MAAGSLLALLDDIVTLLDDVAAMTKTAASKTAGVLGDDLAVNAEQVSGVRAERELPVVWAVAKGSLINKAILVPAALLLSVFLPQLILPILLLGGLFLSYEGAEKIFGNHHHTQPALALRPTLSAADLLVAEQAQIKGAIRTDFVLSIEIIVITLGSVATATITEQLAVLSLVALIATVGVYGIVALIVKLDDIGLHLLQQASTSKQQTLKQMVGRALVQSAPIVLKSLTVIGTWAMFMVGGGIISHSIHQLSEGITHLTHWLQTEIAVDFMQSAIALLLPVFLQIILGLLVGALLLVLVNFAKKCLPLPQQ
jgi:hypothetical protein